LWISGFSLTGASIDVDGAGDRVRDWVRAGS
jgi:hypothetical protein